MTDLTQIETELDQMNDERIETTRELSTEDIEFLNELAE